jgi:hypothetical protein
MKTLNTVGVVESFRHTLLSMLASVAALALVAPAEAQTGRKSQADMSGYRATALEVMQLPQYCWGQFNPQFTGPAYHLPKGCGTGMGHYCPALVSLVRAKKASGDRGYWLNVADDHMGYTIDRLGDPAKCPIAQDVQRYAAEIRALRARSK